jgi:hypothetical protein
MSYEVTCKDNYLSPKSIWVTVQASALGNGPPKSQKCAADGARAYIRLPSPGAPPTQSCQCKCYTCRGFIPVHEGELWWINVIEMMIDCLAKGSKERLSFPYKSLLISPRFMNLVASKALTELPNPFHKKETYGFWRKSMNKNRVSNSQLLPFLSEIPYETHSGIPLSMP